MRGSCGAVRGTRRLADRHASWHVTHRQSASRHVARRMRHNPHAARDKQTLLTCAEFDRSVGVQCTALRLAVLPGATETDVLKIYEVRRAAVAAMRARCGSHACALRLACTRSFDVSRACVHGGRGPSQSRTSLLRSQRASSRTFLMGTLHRRCRRRRGTPSTRRCLWRTGWVLRRPSKWTRCGGKRTST